MDLSTLDGYSLVVGCLLVIGGGVYHSSRLWQQRLERKQLAFFREHAVHEAKFQRVVHRFRVRTPLLQAPL